MNIETESDLINSLHVEQRKAYWKLKRQARFDAFKAGMSRAANITVCGDCKQLILTTRDNIKIEEI